MPFVRRRNLIVAVSLLLLVCLAITSARAHANRTSHLGAATQIWIGTATTRGTLARIDPTVASDLLGAPRAITLGAPVGAPVALSWSSERRFARQVAERTSSPSARSPARTGTCR
jgi:hypothetical protein